MSSQPIDQQHPVVGVVERVGCELGSLAGVPLLSMAPEQIRAVLVRISEDEAQLAALKLRVLAHAESSEATVASGSATVRFSYRHRGRRRGPAGSHIWAGLLLARHGQEHLWYRLLHAGQYWQQAWC